MGTYPHDAINLAHALHDLQVILAMKQPDKDKIRALTLLLLDPELNKRLDRILPELRG